MEKWERLVMVSAGILAEIAILVAATWILIQLWLLRTVGIVGPIDIGFGIP